MADSVIERALGTVLSNLTECTAPPIRPEFPSYRTWLEAYGANSIFLGRTDDHTAALRFIRLAVGALDDYEEARQALLEFIPKRGVYTYFCSLRRFEQVTGQIKHAMDLTRGTPKIDLFALKDGKFLENINGVYNAYKHKLPPDNVLHFQPTWISNDGLHARDWDKATAAPKDLIDLPFADLAHVLRGVAKIAENAARREGP
jgi:hypothetical protein